MEAFTDGVIAIIITIMVQVTRQVRGGVLWANLHILQTAILAGQGRDSLLARALGRDLKGKLSPLAYAIAIPAAFFDQRISGALYVLVALMWLVPDRRIERAIAESGRTTGGTVV
jgi:uncharacterized membrane protein